MHKAKVKLAGLVLAGALAFGVFVSNGHTTVGGSDNQPAKAAQQLDNLTRGGGPTVEAATEPFLKIEGIDGESTDEKHTNWIEILTF